MGRPKSQETAQKLGTGPTTGMTGRYSRIRKLQDRSPSVTTPGESWFLRVIEAELGVGSRSYCARIVGWGRAEW